MRRHLRGAWPVACMMWVLAACASCQRETGCLPSTTTAPQSPMVADDGTSSSDETTGTNGLAYLDAFAAPAQLDPLTEKLVAGCDTCHVDVVDQFVSSRHFQEEVGCTHCHGPSREHAADENNEIKPDEVLARSDIDRLCGECHKCTRPPSKNTASPQVRPQVCTDCHSAHRLTGPT